MPQRVSKELNNLASNLPFVKQGFELIGKGVHETNLEAKIKNVFYQFNSDKNKGKLLFVEYYLLHLADSGSFPWFNVYAKPTYEKD